MAMMLDCDAILPARLWVGSFVRPEEIGLLGQMRITAAFSLQSDRELAIYNISIESLLKAYASTHIEFHRFPADDFDREALSAKIPQAVADLDSALSQSEAKAYVYCTAGVNRAPTLAAAYLIKMLGLSAQGAFEFIVARRQCSPYLSILQNYEVYLKNAGAG